MMFLFLTKNKRVVEDIIGGPVAIKGKLNQEINEEKYPKHKLKIKQSLQCYNFFIQNLQHSLSLQLYEKSGKGEEKNPPPPFSQHPVKTPGQGYSCVCLQHMGNSVVEKRKCFFYRFSFPFFTILQIRFFVQEKIKKHVYAMVTLISYLTRS